MDRIKILDSFRCIAIMMVIFDHYTGTFTNHYMFNIYHNPAIVSPYPYGDKYSFLVKGAYGVQLFFMISGFVIYMTLEKTKDFFTFIKKRFLRLFPLLLICSVITYLAPLLLDPEKRLLVFHRPLHNFFPSLSFLDLFICNAILKTKVEYIDGAYWTLGIEMKYYIYVGVVYFISKKNFFRNWLIINLSITFLYAIITYLLRTHSSATIVNIEKFFQYLLFSRYIMFFTIGSLFYRLYKQIPSNTATLILIGLSVMSSMVYFTAEEFLVMFFFSGLFLLFVYKPNTLSFLKLKPIVFIGMVSYPLYLIHQNIGVMLIYDLSRIIHLTYTELLIFPVIAFMILVAYIIHKFVETPINNRIRKYFTIT